MFSCWSPQTIIDSIHDRTRRKKSITKQLQLQEKCNYLTNFVSEKNECLIEVSPSQFLNIWQHYNANDNEHIENEMLDQFVADFAEIANLDGQSTSNDEKCISIQKLKKSFLDAYDDNKDGKIDVYELAQLLPLRSSFYGLFQIESPLETSVEFIKLWNDYDSNNNGFIELEELKKYLSDVFKRKHHFKADDRLLHEYSIVFMNLFDVNKDGMLHLSEMSRLVPVKEKVSALTLRSINFFNNEANDYVFKFYDRDKDGALNEEELHGLLKDILSLSKSSYNFKDIIILKNEIMKRVSNGERRTTVSKKDLSIMLTVMNRMMCFS